MDTEEYRKLHPTPAGVAFGRLVQTLGQTEGTLDAVRYVKSHSWWDTPQVEMFFTKAATSPLSMANTSALLNYGFSNEFLTVLSGVSTLEKLLPRTARVPFNTDTPVEVSSASVSQFVGEQQAAYIIQGTLASVRLTPMKLQTLSVATRELLTRGGRAAEQALTRILRNAVAAGQDSAFLDPSTPPTALVRPGGITNGALSQVSSGSTAAQVASDLAAMVAQIGSFHDVCWVTRPRTASYLWSVIPTMMVRDSGETYLLDFPLYTSESSPAQIALMDLGGIVTAFDDDISLERFEHFSYVSVDDPNQSPAATSLVSAWQRNEIGYLITRNITWSRARQSSVVRMTVTY